MRKLLTHRYTGPALALAGFICLSAVQAEVVLAAAKVSNINGPIAKPAKSVPHINTVLANVEEKFATVKDISGVVHLEQMSSDGSAVQAQTTVQARLPNLLRLRFSKPEAFADTIYVLDRKENKVMQYSPITEQVIITSIDQVLSERYVPTTVEQLFSLPSPNDYDLVVLGTENNRGQNLVQISARAKADSASPTFQFWIDQGQWLVSRMKIYDANGQLLFSIDLRDVKLNQNLSETQLKKMPSGAVPVYR